MPNDLSLLVDNLQEIQAAALSSRPLPASLVPNLSGTRLYLASSGWGRAWKWFFFIFACVLGSNLKEKKLFRAIKKTEGLFIRFFETSCASAKRYKSYLRQKTVESATDENNYHQTRKEITEWGRATRSFKHLYRLSDRLTLFIAIYFPQIPPVLCSEQVRRLSSYQKLINLEGWLRAPLPLCLFKKLVCGKTLKPKEKSTIKRWSRTPGLAVRPVHSALKAFVNIIKNELFPESSCSFSDVLNLERNLLNLECEVFYQKDPEHLQWRSRLQPGATFRHLNRRIVLGKQIGGKTDDNNLVFTIQDNTDEVVVIGINRAILGLKKQLAEQQGWCLHTAKCFSIAPSGSFAIYERLHGSLEDYQWKTIGQQVHPQDICILIPVENMLKWMIDEKLSPRKFKLKHLQFDKNRRLKYSKACLPESFNYTDLEEFVFTLAKGNKGIFAHLMEHSGLAAHPIREYYLRVVEDALVEISRSDHADIEEIEDPRVQDKGELLYEQITKIKEECLKHLLVHYICHDERALTRGIQEGIRNYYRQMHLAGTLWPTMQEEVTLAVISGMNLRKRQDL